MNRVSGHLGKKSVSLHSDTKYFININRSDPNRPGTHSTSVSSKDGLQENLDKLQKILGEVGVRV